jgi:alpha-amylase/alpha-mannosidase (GH57 family)
MPPVHLAIVWHQHQPYYPDRVSGENPMPWVRLHGTKDYWGMAMHLKEVPEFRCTINLVPSLLMQLRGYTDENATDVHLEISRRPADGLSEADAKFLLENFFMANHDHMIRPNARYQELLQKRCPGTEPVEKAVKRFNERDFRDLQIWHNLAWMHPLLLEVDGDLKAFQQKGRHWTEADKAWLLDKQLEVLRQIVPLHRELMQSGQVELTTTPLYHPILPLLWDKRSARQAMPGCALPQHLESYKDDAVVQLQRGIEYFERVFEQKPKGLWPSEGSVSQEIIAAIADCGIEWIATDEEILAASTNGWVSRDASGFLRHPELLYRPWRLEEQGRALQIVFRDHALSDLIGFQYQRSDPQHAALDLIGKVEAIGRTVASQNAGRPALVPIILDGENCWEYYPGGGVQFLRNFYRQTVQRPGIRAVRMQDSLREQPASDRIGHLFAGSWISHNFYIWIGHTDDLTAWDLLHETREFLKAARQSGRHAPEALAQAWEEIYIAEGSDWFWWFGDDHSSAQDVLFDQLFRKHLKNVYHILNQTYPTHLDRPIGRGAPARPIHTDPTGFLRVKLDGRGTYFEWINAGRYVAGSERGTMTQVTQGVIREIHFGFDADRLLIRIDTAQSADADLQQIDELRILFTEPQATEVRVTGFRTGQLTGELLRSGLGASQHAIEAVAGKILEIAIPLADLQPSRDRRLEFHVEALANPQNIDRAPREGLISMPPPTKEFELMMWQA